MPLLALITDLHANREATEAVLADAHAQGAQRYAFLGDFVGYGADPGWVVDTIRSMVYKGALAIMGNHDEAVVKGDSRHMVPQARQVAQWTRAQLTSRQIDFLASLPMSVVDQNCLLVHANAFAPSQWGYIQCRAGATRSMQATECQYTFCGHVHEPKLYHLGDSGHSGEFSPTPGVTIPLSKHRRWLTLPGSTGQPRDGNPAASYALFNLESSTLTFQRIPYDHETTAAKILAADLPPRFAHRLSLGI
jgi:diadenosine tetraphosphatase ApaH/serine/threonine PP2A family protein phosphatase